MIVGDNVEGVVVVVVILDLYISVVVGVEIVN